MLCRGALVAGREADHGKIARKGSKIEFSILIFGQENFDFTFVASGYDRGGGKSLIIYRKFSVNIF